MGLVIELQTEIGEALARVVDLKNHLGKLLPRDEAHPFLSSIDPYGNTVFNQLQMNQFINEWNGLRARINDAEALSIITQVEDMARSCQNEVHLYVKFIGD